MSGLKSLRKGKRGEYEARKLLEELGYDVVWQAEDPKKPDLRVNVYHNTFPTEGAISEDWEVKYQAGITKKLWDWFEEKNADALLIKRVNHKDGRSYPWLIVRKLEE